MNKKKLGIIAGALAAVAALGVGGAIYAQGDHSGPSVTVATDFQIGYGETIGLFDLVTAVSDDNEYTIAITSGGDVAADGRSTVFDTAGEAEVEITAEDALGHTTVKTVTVTITDTKPPVLSVSDIEVSVGDSVDYSTGVTAEDEMDGNLTSQIQVDTSQVDLTKAGIYIATYSVTDSSGNEAVVPVAVTVSSPVASGITLSQPSLSLDGNGHYQLTATVEPQAWSGNIQWTSSDESVAVVHDGLITWTGSGSCTITAQADDLTAECQVSCGYVTATSLWLSYSSLTIEYDETQTLTTTVIPSNWSGDVTWSSSDPTVATVEGGTITWVSAGTCTITAMADGRSATCTVICKEPEVESLDILETEINLSADGTYDVTPTILPEIWVGDVTWTSSDESIATVEDGLIRWVSPGTCTITATAGDCTDSVTVICAQRGTISDLIDDIFNSESEDEAEDHNHD